MYCETCGVQNFNSTIRCIGCGGDLLAKYRDAPISAETEKSKQSSPDAVSDVVDAGVDIDIFSIVAEGVGEVVGGIFSGI